MKTSSDVGEGGATAILIALSMLVLLGFAAIAIDSGLKFDERRQEQGGVDAGTLSAGIGAQVAPTQTGCGPFSDVELAVCNGAVVAMDIINKNADAAYPMAGFDNATLCSNAAFPAEFHPGGNRGIISKVVDGAVTRTLECIRWNENMSKVRVILPITAVNTTFGRVLGVNTMNVNAFAEAETSLKRPGQLIPFAVGPTGGAANMGCLYEPPSGQTFPPCDGPEEGNFGYMRPYLYGDVVLNTDVNCNPDQDNIAATFAKGADHIYALNASVPGTANDRANCPNKNQLIDEIDVTTGGSGNAVTEGGLGMIFGTEGRLRCKDGDGAEPTWISPSWSSAACEDVNNRIAETVDDTPLFAFINGGAAAESSGICNGGISDKTAMQSCLAAWRAFGTHSTSLFTAALATSPRFAWIPRVDVDPNSGGSGFYTIEEFLPVYLQTLYLKCNASGPSCDVVFDPGEPSTGACTGTALPCGYPSTGNKSLDGMSAFILRADMLPFPLDQFPGAPGQLLYNLSE